MATASERTLTGVIADYSPLDMGVALKLTCMTCGRVEQPRPGFRWAPNGLLKLQARTTFYVDGGEVRCPAHADRERVAAQRHAYEVEAATLDGAGS